MYVDYISYFLSQKVRVKASFCCFFTCWNKTWTISKYSVFNWSICIQVVYMTARCFSWKPCYWIIFDFNQLWFFRLEWSAAPWIFNIIEQGLVHCVLWMKLRKDDSIKKITGVLYKQNKSNATIKRLIINTVTAYMPIDEIPIVRSFLCSL